MWLFLTLKANSAAGLERRDQYGKQTEQLTAMLISMLATKITFLEENMSKSHAATANFLLSEVDLLSRVKAKLVSEEGGIVDLKRGQGFNV